MTSHNAAGHIDPHNRTTAEPPVTTTSYRNRVYSIDTHTTTSNWSGESGGGGT